MTDIIGAHARRLYEAMRDALLAERCQVAGPFLDFDMLPSGERRAWRAVAAIGSGAMCECGNPGCRHGGCQGRRPVTTVETFDSR